MTILYTLLIIWVVFGLLLYLATMRAFKCDVVTLSAILKDEDKVLDSNGNELKDGDSVVVIKDLPVKGAPKPIKAGTKVKNIRLRPDSDHNIDCKIDGIGPMKLKSEFVKKA